MKYSDVLMLSMNDTITLGQRVDVRKALNLRTMFKETGKERIDVRTILNEDAPPDFVNAYPKIFLRTI